MNAEMENLLDIHNSTSKLVEMFNSTNNLTVTRGDNNTFDTPYNHPQWYVFWVRVIIAKISICSVAGTFLNTLLLVSILTSAELRGKLRNQLICNMAALHLLETLVEGPLTVTMLAGELYWKFPSLQSFCRVYRVSNALSLYQNMVGELLMVALATSYLIDVLQVDLDRKFKTEHIRYGRIAAHALPWIFPVFTIKDLINSNKYMCIIDHRQFYYKLLTVVYIIVPLSVAIVVTFTAYILQRRQLSGSDTLTEETMETQLLAHSSSQRDQVHAYTSALATCVFCEMFSIIRTFSDDDVRKRLSISSLLLSESRVVLLVFPWLFLTDINDRILGFRRYQSGRNMKPTAATEMDIIPTFVSNNANNDKLIY